jgi:hypothetical protein
MKKTLLCGSAALLMTALTVTTVKPAHPRLEQATAPATVAQPSQAIAAIEHGRHVVKAAG